MSDPIRVLLVDDHALLRETVAKYIGDTDGIQVVGQVASAHEAIIEAAKVMPDILLMDIDMPGASCFDATKAIQKSQPDVRIIFLSGFFHDSYIEQALECNALGYITKNEPSDVVIAAIREVADGGVYYSPQVTDRIVVDSSGAKLGKQGKSRFSTLSPRELEVLRYIAKGLSKKDIGVEMHISTKTVENHSNSLMTKLNIHDRVRLTRFAIREGLVEA